MARKKEERQRELVHLIRQQGRLPVKRLSTILRVSEMTIRRDLAELSKCALDEADNLNEVSEHNTNYDLFEELEKEDKQKNAIGRFAATLIEPNDTIIIDTGSTTARMLSHIPSNKNLTVVCYNANVLLEMRYKAGIDLMFCGGVFHRNTQMFESPEGINFIERIRANKVFLSAAGVHKDMGITCVNNYEVPTKQAVIQSSLQIILLVDSTKFNKIRPALFCEMDDINAIVTDKNLSPKWQNYIKETGITLYLV